MDRRQQKTRKLIFQAFSKLLKKKKYESITVQDIIDEADIGRSTFYAHFETKDELLHSICKEIFEHISDHQLDVEKSHDFSDKEINLKNQLTHLLYHLRERQDITGSITEGRSRQIFSDYLKSYLRELLAEAMPGDGSEKSEFMLNHLVCDYTEMVNWWAERKMNNTPEQMIEYYYQSNRI